MIAPMPGAIPTKRGSATRPIPGVAAEVVTREGKPVGANQGGLLIIRRPWPGMLRRIFRDPALRTSSISARWRAYFTGDGARRDQDGYFWIMGRVDDVINVSGHGLGTMEIESALVSHPMVAEAAVVGKPDEMKGQAVVAFVTLEGARHGDAKLRDELRQHVVKEIGALARPTTICASPTRCRKRGAARSCAGCCAKSRRATRSWATPPRSKICRCWPACAKRRVARKGPRVWSGTDAGLGGSEVGIIEGRSPGNSPQLRTSIYIGMSLFVSDKRKRTNGLASFGMLPSATIICSCSPISSETSMR